MTKLTPGAREILRQSPEMRELFENRPKWRFPNRKPDEGFAAEKISPRMAQAVRENPGSVRMVAELEGTTIIDRPRGPRVTRVLEVDGAGRPKLVESYDPQTSSHGVVEFCEGYSPRAGVESAYHPIAKFEEGIDR